MGQQQNKTPGDKEQADNETKLVYTDSSTFLKGTQSSNPHNDYCQHFVDTGQRPQNFIRDVGLADRYLQLLGEFFLFEVNFHVTIGLRSIPS